MAGVTTEGYRISPAQKRLWLQHQRSSAYLAQAAIKIEGPVDISCLETAVARVVDRLEILRTTFRRQAGMRAPLQVISDGDKLTWRRIDWSGQGPSQVDASLEALLGEQRTRSVNLDTGPLLELCIARVSAQEQYLIVSLPSLCADALSLANLFDELVDAYSGESTADKSEEPLQYADFADWHCQLLDEDEQSAVKAYWREQQLNGSALSTGRQVRKRESQDGFAVAIAALPIDQETALAAKSLASDKGIPVSDFYLACWQTLAWRLFGQPDVVIGAVADQRGHETLRDACGLFAVTLPVRHRFDDGMRFEEVLDTVVRARSAASDRQYEFSWERNVEGGGTTGEPVFFPLAFQFYVLPVPRKSGQIAFTVARSFSCADRFHIQLNCVQHGDAIRIEWHFDANLLPREEIERLARHYRAIVRSAVDNPRALALDLEVLDDAQRQEIVGFNDAKADFSIDACVHERFEEVAQRAPDRAALVYEQQVLTYGALNARSNQLAHRLRAAGVGPDVPVGLCVERSADMILGMLGILKAGGAYVPLDSTLPTQRLALLIEDSRAPVVVCQPHLAELFTESRAECVVLNDDASSRAATGTENCSSGVTPANLVYTLFTSGSTGTPKGVLIEHRQLLNYVEGVRVRLQLPPDASFATVSSYAADLGNTAIFSALLSGGCLHVVSQDRVMDPAAMAEYGERHAIDCLKIVPSHLAALLSAPRPERVLPRRRLVLGGEASTWDLVKQVEALASDCQIMNHYGPTETTVGVMTFRHPRGQLRADQSDTLPLGRPLSNSQIYILDARTRPVPIGVSGELHIGGAGLARGYVNRPDQTAASFVPNPFNPDPGARMYRTGDLACYLSDGNVEFLGRADHQVKIRGFRVELGEIESILGHHESVSAAVVLAREDAPGDKRLVGYAVRERDARVTAEGLRAYIAERLPDYMVPSAIVLLDQLPLNRNGKVDRAALLVIQHTTEPRKGSPVPPRTSNEEKLLEIFSGVLGNWDLGVLDDFFESGGHSLLAMQLIVRVREAFHVDLPLPALFDAPTVAGLAESIESLIGAGGSDLAPAMTPVARDQHLPLSFAQQRLWFLEQLEPDAVAYNRTVALRLGGRLNRTALEQTLGEILRRHEVLRTVYPEVDGKAVQVIAPPTPLSLPLVSLAGLAPVQQDAEIHRLIQEDSRRRFDLAEGPLVRLWLLQLSEVDHVLISSQHHINTDGWSNGVYLREVSSLYGVFANGRPSPLGELPVQYADYAVWQREWLEGESLKAQLSYWKQELQNAPASLDLPTDRPRPAMQTFHGARREFSISPSQSQLLKELSGREGTTLFMTLLAAFQALLCRYTGQADILVGSPIAGRARAEVEGLIGFFVNTLALRADFSGNPTFLELLAQVRERALQGYAHQDLPFETLVDELELERDLSRTPLFQVMFVLQTDSIESLSLPGLTVQPVETDIQTAKFDLTLNVLETERGLKGSLEYNTDLFEATSIDRMLAHFKVLVEGITTQPERRLAELPLLPDSERQQLLVEWNDTRVAYRDDVCVHQLFEAQVEQTPDAVAVISRGQQVTYRVLNELANHHARHLTSLGVTAGVLVGLCIERSVEMVASLLGVLKSGGAYVPLDPSYPTHRLQFMLKDSGVAVVLTQNRLRAKLPETSAVVHDVDSDWAHRRSLNLENPTAVVTPGDLAYVIYTSGSTGTPKGAMIEHRGVLNYLNWCANAYPVSDGVGSPVQSSIGFDATITSFFTPLLAGRSVVLLPEEQEIEALSTALSSGSDFSLVKLTPAHLKMLNQMVPLERARGGTRAFIIGGEALVGSDVAFWRMHAPESRLINEYGPTETVVGCCVYEVSTTTPDSGGVSIGRPIHNTQAHVLNSALELTPIHVPGELYIGGAGVGRGYLNRPDLTAERFVPDRFSESPGARLYRTGDLVRHHTDGNLEFLGRLDDQVKIRGYRIELGEIEAVLSQHANVREAVVVAQEDRPGSLRLVAYVACREHPAPTFAEFRSHLLEQLPGYMVPAIFLTLEKLPLSSNGKVDRRALPKPDQARLDPAQDLVVARTPVEELLSEIWSRALGLERVGVHDNFFQLGGDSILSIQIVSQANRAGLGLTPKDIFQHQTIAELAATARPAQVIDAVQGPVTGPVPLTAIQHWFFEQEFADPHHFNQSVLLQAPSALDPERLEAALKALVAHHDVLRHSFRQEGSAWHQSGGAVSPMVSFSTFDLSALPESEQALETERLAGQLQQSLDLSQGPLVRAAQFKLGSDGPVRLLLVIHHLVVDGVSWRILLEDLQTAYEQLTRGETIRLPAKTTSFAHFSRRCAELANSASFLRELDYWLTRPASPISRLPVDYPQGRNTVDSGRSITVALNPEETGVLLREVPPVYKTQVNDVLLTALVEAFARWTGSSSWVVDLEGHGREELFDDVDLSRTVGWFTTLFPVRFELGMPDDQSAALKSVKEQLRAVPNRGMGYGLLRYLSRSSEQIERLRSQPRAEVTFNYLGQVDRVLPEGSRFQWARESSGPTQSQSASRSHLLDVRGLISAGSLQVSFQYSENVFRGETIEQLARSFLAALRSLISHCQSSEAGGYTSSDFELANLTQSEIDRHFGNDRTLEDVYALSPLQKGMLFHCLHAPNSGAYLSHLVLRLDGALDVQAFKRTWDRLIARHTVFRTGFLWDQVSEPVQVVRRNTEIVWSEEDWCGADAETQRADLRSFLKRDRIRGFDLSNAPLIRLALIRMAERAHYFVWTHHHLVIDGWSVPLVLQEAFELYKAFLSGAEAPLPPARPFRDYIAWLGKQDFVKAESYWRRTLAGLEEPTSLGVSRTADDGAGEVGNAEYQSRLSPASTRSLRAFARQHDLTVNTVVQGAWALLLGAYSGEEHVVYGAALSGRPPSLVDVTRIPGMFINTLPIRAFIDAEMSVREWLGRLQEQQVEMREYEYSALTEVQSWSQVPRSVPLFDVIVAFQNFPVDKTLIEEAALHGLGIELVLSQEQSTSPLTLFVALEEELSVRLVYDRKRFDEGTIAGIANRYLRVLESIVSNGDAALMDLRIDTNVTVPQLQAMAIRPPSAEELLLLGSGADDMEKVTFERED